MYKSFLIILSFSGRILRDVRAADSVYCDQGDSWTPSLCSNDAEKFDNEFGASGPSFTKYKKAYNCKTNNYRTYAYINFYCCFAPVLLDTTSCQNNYEADNQLFHVHGKQWRANTVPLKEGYVVTRGIGAHKLHRRKVKWNAARQTCLNEGGDLAVINSLAEESILLNLVRQRNLNEVWVGTHDLFEEGDWVTVTGESLEKAGYDKWSTVWPQPDNYGGHQNCGALVKEGGMDDMECQVLNAFFCEVNIY